jgi:hypothetical protein
VYLCDVRGKGDERSSSVDGGTGIFKFKSLFTECKAIKTDFPVTTSSNGKPSNVTSIMIFVISTKDCLTAVFRVLVCITKIERKYFIVN